MGQRKINFRAVLYLRLDAAGAGKTPAGKRLVNGKEAGDDEHQAQPQDEIHQNNAGDEAERADDTARDASVTFDVGLEEMAHGQNLAQRFSVASRRVIRQIDPMDLMNLDSNALWASILWGGVGGGYLIYGWRQRESVPLVGGVVMSLACFLPALPMTLISIVTMGAVYWLMKQGY